MGASNVAMAFAHWTHLDHREMRALIFMANISLDADTPPVYFGGWEALANALGADLEGKRESARRTAVRVLGALTKSGAIVSSGQARTGVRAEYALALDPSVTYKPTGKGRNVTWQQVRVSPQPETAKATQSKGFTPGYAEGYAEGYGIDLTQPETATGMQGETAKGIHPETAKATQGETATVPNLRQLRVSLGTTSGTTEEYLEEKLEEYPSSFSQLTSESTQKTADAKNSPKKIDDENSISEEQNRQRQMAALQELMKAEQL